MGTLTCIECNKSWYAKGVSNNTICEKCSQVDEVDEDEISEEFEELVKGMFLEEELESLDLDWEEIKLLAAEQAALQIRWQLAMIKKGSVK